MIAAIVDAFTDRAFCGNQAGVVILGRDEFPSEAFMLSLATELGYSETAFVRQTDSGFDLRFYSPVCPVALCGHATVATFTALRVLTGLALGDYEVETAAGKICVSVEADAVWLDMAEAVIHRELKPEESAQLYAAYALPPRDNEGGLVPAMVSVGLCDIMLPVADEAELARAVQDAPRVEELSRLHGVTGVHMYCVTDDDYTAHCRNFAPLYGIDEECATGTSNGALYLYLLSKGRLRAGERGRFLQGESMKRPSLVMARSGDSCGSTPKIRVGGSAKLLFSGELKV